MKKHSERALIASALWLHVGFIGAAALVAGLLQLFDGGPALPLSLGLMLSGGALTAAGWHRGWNVLEHAERASAASIDSPIEAVSRNQSRPTGRVATGTLTLIALRSNAEDRQ